MSNWTHKYHHITPFLFCPVACKLQSFIEQTSKDINKFDGHLIITLLLFSLMGLGCKLNMIRWGLPSVHSPFTTNSSPLCCSPSIRGKELDLGSARLSLLTMGFDESETMLKDSSRPHACPSPAAQTVENDYSNMEMIISKRSHKGLHHMIIDTQIASDKETSAFVQSIQACNSSHFHLLMENISVLESSIAESDVVNLEKDILVHLARLGALKLFHACLSKSLADPTFTDMSKSPADLTRDCQVEERIDHDWNKNMIRSKRKEERKTRQERRTQTASKKYASKSESFVEGSVSAARKTKAMGRRVMVAKNEAEMSRGIKVVAKLEKVKATMEKETGRAVTLSAWAEAAGIEEKVLQQYLHFGWYCKDELLKSGRSLVVYLARNYRGLGVAYEDLIQAGNIGILQGAERFDHTRGYQFSTYAQYWIRKAMSQLVSRHGRGIKIPLTLSTAINRVQKARKAFKRTHGKHPDDVDLANFTGLSLDKVKSANKCLRVVGSTDKKIGDMNIKYLECTADTSLEMAEKRVMREHRRNDIDKLLNELDPKERRVLILRFGFGGHCMSLHEVGKIFNVSKEWIRRMEKKALTKLKDEDNQKSLTHYLDL